MGQGGDTGGCGETQGRPEFRPAAARPSVARVYVLVWFLNEAGNLEFFFVLNPRTFFHHFLEGEIERERETSTERETAICFLLYTP